MENTDKVIKLLKEHEFYSRLLANDALKKEKELKLLASRQAIIGQSSNTSKSYNYKVEKNQSNPSFNQKYLCKKYSFGIADQNKRNGLYNQGQNFHSKYSLSKSKILSSTTSVNKFAANKNFKSNVSFVHAKSITNCKGASVKAPSVSCKGSEKSAYNTKDFFKEIEAFEELLKKKISESSCKNLNLASKCESATQNSPKKEQNSAVDNLNSVKNERLFSEAKGLVGMESKIPANLSSKITRKYSINSNINNPLQQNTFNSSKFSYKKNNVKPLQNGNFTASLKNIKNTDQTKGGFQKIISKPASRKVIFSNPNNVSHNLCTSGSAGLFQRKILSSGTQELIVKLQTPVKISSTSRKVLKNSPQVNKTNSPILLKIKSSNSPNIMKLKQTNTRYKKVNKHLTTSNKRMQLQNSTQQRSSIKKTKKKVNRYTVINKTLTPCSTKKIGNALFSPGCKKNSLLSMDCDSFLKNFNDSAVDKLEQNLLAMTSELTDPLLSENNEICDSKIIQPLSAKVNSKLAIKKTPFKKTKSRISKYKIINSNVSQKYSSTNMKSMPKMSTPNQEKVVLVRRLFKSKNVIINKNSTQTNYRAKMIKSKYLSLNKRKSFNQKYTYPTVSLHTRYKGSFLATKLHPQQKTFKTNSASMYHSRLIRKTSYASQIYKNKLIYKNSGRKGKTKINNRYVDSPVVFIRGTRYAKNLNGKTLRKLPMKGHSVRNFQRASRKWIMRTPENFIKASPASTNLASRVLHRSINRILIASSKKSLSKVNTYCMFYNRFGRCNRGVKCCYIHDPSKIAICTRFLRGTCKIDGCPFSHEVDPGKMAICSFFLVGQCDKENCPYRHEKLSPNAVLCKDFVQGYCRYGKECKKAHILMCPKYVRGECNKGSLCVFPHPPQKEKKNIHKEVEDEETKPTEVLLEKVLRYFQQGGDSQNKTYGKSTSRLFVPKQRKLEEQPSFIPLSASPAVQNKNN